MKNYDEERSEKLLNLYSGAITDIMDALSPDYRNQTLPSNSQVRLCLLVMMLQRCGATAPVVLEVTVK